MASRGEDAVTTEVLVEEGRPQERLGSTSYELFILLLSILSIFNLVIVSFLSDAGRQVILIADTILVLFFLADFAIRFHRSRPRRRDYLLRDFGWADLIAILPGMRIFRIFRIVRVTNRLHRFGLRQMLHEVRENRSTSAFGITIFLVILVVEIAGAGIVEVERSADGAQNINTGSDAVWWAYVTITTVGYGDKYPVTDTGRVLGVLLLTSGVALFSVLTGFVANFFLGPRRHVEDDDGPRPIRPVDPSGRIAELVQLLDEQDARNAVIRRELRDLERGGPGGASPGS